MRKLAATTAAAMFLMLLQGGSVAHAVGVCGGGPHTQKPMSVLISVEAYWTPQPHLFTYRVSGPRDVTGTIVIPDGSHQGSAEVNGLERGSYTVSVRSDVTPPESTDIDVVPPGCGIAADFVFISEP